MPSLKLGRIPVWLVAIAGALCVPRSPCAAQEASAGWQVTFTPYLWFAGQTGQVGARGFVSDVDLSFGDIVENLDMALMGTLEARHGRWAGRLDLVYVSVSAEQVFTQPAVGEADLGLDEVVIQPEIGYAVLQRPWGGIDALVGIRYWDISTELDLSLTGGPSASEEGGKSWVDGTVGGRIRYRAGEKWRLYGKVDVGAGGADFTWQALGGAAYDLGRCCALTAAYRHLDVDYDSDGFLFDVYLTGPALGVELRF